MCQTITSIIIIIIIIIMIIIIMWDIAVGGGRCRGYMRAAHVM